MKKIFIITVFLSLFTAAAFGQHCLDYHKSNCRKSRGDGEFPFTYNGQSRSALFERGQTSDLKFIAYKGQDYRISICMDKRLGTEAYFKIKDARSGDVLYDNAKDEMVQEFEFTCENTRKLALEVYVPGDDVGSGGGGDYMATTDMACLGVLIEHKPTEKTGF